MYHHDDPHCPDCQQVLDRHVQLTIISLIENVPGFAELLANHMERAPAIKPVPVTPGFKDLMTTTFGQAKRK